jgi:hypothetical protein
MPKSRAGILIRCIVILNKAKDLCTLSAAPDFSRFRLVYVLKGRDFQPRHEMATRNCGFSRWETNGPYVIFLFAAAWAASALALFPSP